MKKLFFLPLALLLLGFSHKCSENVYDILFNTLDGTEKSMMTFEGQKLLIVVLPGQARNSDTTLLRRLGDISRQYSGQFRVIGVPANEDGFTPATAPVEWYQNYLGGEVLITEGMNTASGISQSPLLSWLSTRTKNGSFGQEVSGVGHAFFMNGVGELLAVLDKDTELSDAVIERMTAL